ncbi:hypothetical protein [Bacillus taeanensis]|uniref:Uncharacterized protein n=1 Tax=Bacillus taeanensis TaxID=273032 RepID=A0A366XWS3_9BACI|nr:hypothetical protein [Bacillus taeanensis]RBW68594.1 hypothetical protein DS031_15650 [Bacillus taeanensis]
MKELARKLITMIKAHEGKNFDAILQDKMEDRAGFSFMSRVKCGDVHFHPERLMVSEPITGNYFCLPLNGIKEIHDETTGKDDVAFTVTYNHNYEVFIQIFQPF